jgi:excinuclease ABC subunit C
MKYFAGYANISANNMTATTQPASIDSILASLPKQPGVYKMLDDKDEVIYVGKAANLKKRVTSYFQKAHPDPKTVALVSHIRDIETIITHTESEALLLENNLIKSLKPRYNILYRDDKSYPYIYVSTDQIFPRLTFHRGAQRGKGRYFGPYPSAGAVRETLALLQKIFPVRQCKDSFYKNRSRPCLQFQIKRCTAPCVGYVSPEDYGEDVRHAIMFLEGKSNQVIEELNPPPRSWPTKERPHCAIKSPACGECRRNNISVARAVTMTLLPPP